jgi:hypothetical protein
MARYPNAVAVFARNHVPHLEAAVRATIDDATRRVAFRSNKPWSAARDRLKSRRPRRIYFAVVDGGARISYEAYLEEVYVRPDEAQLEELRPLFTERTRDETWEKLATVYVVSRCRRVSKPYPLSDLSKRDRHPLADNFKYSYAIVLERCERCGNSPCSCEAAA